MPAAFAIPKTKAGKDAWAGPNFYLGYLGEAWDSDEYAFETRFWSAIGPGYGVGQAFDVAKLGAFNVGFSANWYGTTPGPAGPVRCRPAAPIACEVVTMRTRTHSLSRGRRVRLAGAVVVAGTAIALGLRGGTPAGNAADRYVAGGPAVERTPLGGDRAAPTLALAAAFRSRLGLPEPATTRVEQVVDRFDGTTYEEVTGSDAAGQTIHLQRFDARGRLVACRDVRVAGGRPGPLANAAAARTRASRLAADLGLETPGAPDIRQAADNAGWTLTWSRVVDGVPVIGDGLRLDLWPDGRLHAVVRTERPLARPPGTALPEAAARDRTTTTLTTMFGSRFGTGRAGAGVDEDFFLQREKGLSEGVE